MNDEIEKIAAEIELLWSKRSSLKPGDDAPPVRRALELMDAGRLRVCEPDPEDETGWRVNAFAKQAVLLSFRLSQNRVMKGGADDARWWDKIPLKTEGWTEEPFIEAGFRMAPGAIVRRSAFVAPSAVLMPSFVNVGAYVGENTMIDTWATVGSCAQIGARCHISGGAGVGGVLEPLQARPVVIEDDCFIGARAEVAEGMIIRRGAVIAMGVYLGASTKIVDRDTGEIWRGEVPPYAVVAPGALPPRRDGEPSLACAVIVKRVDERTRAKTAINELLREAD